MKKAALERVTPPTGWGDARRAEGLLSTREPPQAVEGFFVKSFSSCNRLMR